MKCVYCGSGEAHPTVLCAPCENHIPAPGEAPPAVAVAGWVDGGHTYCLDANGQMYVLDTEGDLVGAGHWAPIGSPLYSSG